MTAEYQITVEPLGREITCREDQTVLDACLRAGVWVPHSCTHGTCATCKAEVLEGDVEHGEASPYALMDFERDEGKFLPCVARPRSGLVFELDRDLVFNAGQYMSLEIPGHDGVTRTYSMANPPAEQRRIEFQIRLTAGGLATEGWVFKDLAVGDTIKLSGPYGRFVLREDRSEPAVMIAGGTGLAPIASMIRRALEEGAGEVEHIYLYQGARTQEWMYDVDRFRALAEEFPDRFTYRPCLSEEEAEGFATGMVTDVLAADHETLKGHVGYVCGPPMMVEAALKTLMLKRLFPRDIFKEEFLDASAAATQIRSPLIKR